MNRRSVDVGAPKIWLAPSEYVVLRKLEYFREGGSTKHLFDIRAIIRTSDLDIVAIES